MILPNAVIVTNSYAEILRLFHFLDSHNIIWCGGSALFDEAGYPNMSTDDMDGFEISNGRLLWFYQHEFPIDSEEWNESKYDEMKSAGLFYCSVQDYIISSVSGIEPVQDISTDDLTSLL